MRSNTISAGLATRIQELIEKKQEHEAAIVEIVTVLESVGAALGNGARAKPGRKKGSTAAAGDFAAPAKRSRGRRRGRYATTGDDSILSFIKAHKNPTTQEIKAHWSDEGRGGTADNVLSKLYRAKRLKRESLDGQRGSRYMLA